jgi:butyryl-CoA dehydrogenase
LKSFSALHESVLVSQYGQEAETGAALLRGVDLLLQEKVAPFSLALDRGGSTIDGPRRALFEHGLCRMPYPAELGGAGAKFGVFAMAMELVGSADASTAMSIGIHNTVAEAVARFGTPEQRERLLPGLLAGEKLAAFALTEPSSGSDARSMHTRATKGADGYVIEGSKMFITNAGEADVYLVFAATSGGHGAFLVESSNSGLKVGGELGKLGMRGSHTAEVRLVDCHVSAGSLLGKEGAGFEYAKQLLDSSRIVMGMICVGIARAAYDRAIAYSKARELFGKRLSDLDLTKEKIADASIGINAARLLCMQAARLKEAGKPYSSEAAQGKVFASETAVRVCDWAIQLFGGYGYTDEDIHRHWRDARLLTIGEGASEVLRLLIASRELEREG